MASAREPFEISTATPRQPETAEPRTFGSPSSTLISNHSYRMNCFAAPAHRVYTESTTFTTGVGPESTIADESVDLGAAVATRHMRLAVCLAFCQSVQAFMSYDGGATPASMSALREDTDGTDQEFSMAEEGLLGSMDKFGIVLTSMMWGILLQRCHAKVILVIGLGLNALSTFLFGSLRNKACMFTMKFIMGGTQSLQGVWGTVWTMLMAPPDARTTWLGFGAISAGVGNGVGTIVAGWGTGSGLGYAFAFQLQAVILGVLWVAMVFTPARLFAISLPATAMRTVASDKQELVSSRATMRATTISRPSRRSEGIPDSRGAQLRLLWENKVFVYTTLWISLIMFEGSALQFYWFQVFNAEGTWGINQRVCTIMFLLVNLVFGGIGVALGPSYFDSLGGYGTSQGMVTTLLAMRRVAFIAAALGPLAVGLIGLKVACGTDWRQMWEDMGVGNMGDPWLWATWLCVGGIYAAHNASVAVCCGINVEVIPVPMRSLSSSAEMTVRNIMGYAFGPLLPSLFISAAAAALGWDLKTPEQNGAVLYMAFGGILIVNLSVVLISGRAVAAAKGRHPPRAA